MSYKLYSPYDRPAHQWDSRNLLTEIEAVSERPLLGLLLRHLRLPGARVLEAGCGFGAWCEELRRRGFAVVGLENQASVVEEARDVLPDIPVEVGDVTDIRYPDNHFDAYVSLGVIEHFEEGPEKALREAVRVLKPGGFALITVPSHTIVRRLFSHRARDLYFWINALRGRRKYFGEYRYSMAELKRYVTGAGLLVVEEGVDDYSSTDPRRNMGLYTDWFFLRKKDGRMWELSTVGRGLLRVLRVFLSESRYCCGWYVIAKKPD